MLSPRPDTASPRPAAPKSHRLYLVQQRDRGETSPLPQIETDHVPGPLPRRRLTAHSTGCVIAIHSSAETRESYNLYWMRSRRSSLIIMLAAALAIAGAAFYGRSTKAPTTDEGSAATSAPQQCGSCHPAIHRDYQHVGMARSFAPASKTTPPEYNRATTFFHKLSGRY